MNSKKILGTLLAMGLMMALALPAFASPSPDTTPDNSAIEANDDLNEAASEAKDDVNHTETEAEVENEGAEAAGK